MLIKLTMNGSCKSEQLQLRHRHFWARLLLPPLGLSTVPASVCATKRPLAPVNVICVAIAADNCCKAAGLACPRHAQRTATTARRALRQLPGRK